MKNSFFICYLLLSLCSFSLANVEFPFIGIISADKVNVRAGYNQNFEILMKLSKDDKVAVLGERFSWYKVKLPSDNASCYINENYLENIDGKTGKVIANHINLRARPQINSTILCQVSKDQILKIISKQNQWYEIKVTDACFGWINRDFVKFLAPFTENSDSANLIKTKGTPKIKEAEGALRMNQPVAIGIIEDVGKIIGLKSKHKLVQENGEIFYLKGDIRILNNFIYKRVKIYGKVNYLKGQKYPLIIMERIEPL